MRAARPEPQKEDDEFKKSGFSHPFLHNVAAYNPNPSPILFSAGQ
jgi:hypothetical protein